MKQIPPSHVKTELLNICSMYAGSYCSAVGRIARKGHLSCFVIFWLILAQSKYHEFSALLSGRQRVSGAMNRLRNSLHLLTTHQRACGSTPSVGRNDFDLNFAAVGWQIWHFLFSFFSLLTCSWCRFIMAKGQSLPPLPPVRGQGGD